MATAEIDFVEVEPAKPAVYDETVVLTLSKDEATVVTAILGKVIWLDHAREIGNVRIALTDAGVKGFLSNPDDSYFSINIGRCVLDSSRIY